MYPHARQQPLAAGYHQAAEDPILVLPLLLIISKVVVNRVWHVERFGGKLRSCPRRSPGGFLWEALRQALALGFKVLIASARGQDAAGDFLEATLRDTGADIGGLRTAPLPTVTAEVVASGSWPVPARGFRGPSWIWPICDAFVA